MIGECLGRSRGGFTTKIHLAADGRCRPLALVLTPGHYGDGPQLERVLEQVSVPRIGVGRPRTRPDHRTVVTCDDAASDTSSPSASTSRDTARIAVPEAVVPPASTASDTRSATPSNAQSTA